MQKFDIFLFFRIINKLPRHNLIYRPHCAARGILVGPSLCSVFYAYSESRSRPEWVIFTRTPHRASQTGYPVRLCACAVQARSLETGLLQTMDVSLLNSRLSRRDGPLFGQWLYFSCVISPVARFTAVTLVMTSIVAAGHVPWQPVFSSIPVCNHVASFILSFYGVGWGWGGEGEIRWNQIRCYSRLKEIDAFTRSQIFLTSTDLRNSVAYELPRDFCACMCVDILCKRLLQLIPTYGINAVGNTLLEIIQEHYYILISEHPCLVAEASIPSETMMHSPIS